MADSHAVKTRFEGLEFIGLGRKKLGMWLFLVSDSLTFATLLVSYSYLRIANEWPHPFSFFPAIVFSSVMTLVLLSSSLTMVLGVSASQAGDRRAAAKWMWLTALGGVIFIVLHLMEWRHLVQDGVTPFQNPWGAPLFGGTFYLITGLHMTHVAIGVVYLAVLALGFRRGRFDAEDIETGGLYWHFVDLVWMFVFPLIYLMSVEPV